MRTLTRIALLLVLASRALAQPCGGAGPTIVGSYVCDPAAPCATLLTPAGTQAGDTLLVGIAYMPTGSTPSLGGFTLLYDDSDNAGGKYATFTQYLTGAPASSYAFNMNGSTRNMSAMFVIRATDPTTPVDVTSVNHGNGTNETALSVTTTVANDLLVLLWSMGQNTTINFTMPGAGETSAWDRSSSGTYYLYGNAGAYRALGAAGATGNYVGIASSSNNPWTARQIAFQGAACTPTPTNTATDTPTATNTPTATITPTPTVTPTPNSICSGSSLDVTNYNGSGGPAQASDSPSLSIVGDFTILAKLKITGATNLDGYILDKNHGSNGYYFRYRGSDGKLLGGTCASGCATERVSNTVVTGSAWHCVAEVYDHTNLNFYLDGNADGGGADTTNPADNAGALVIGSPSNGDGNSKWRGLMDDVMVYNRALSSGEIANLCSGVDVSTGRVSWWKFDEGIGTTSADSVGNTNPLTLDFGSAFNDDTPAGVCVPRPHYRAQAQCGNQGNHCDMTVPGGVQSTDVGVAHCLVSDLTTTVTPPSGWNTVGFPFPTSSNDGSGNTARTFGYWRLGGSGSQTWNFSSGTPYTACVAQWIANADNVNPFDAWGVQSQSNINPLVSPSIVPGHNGDYIAFFAATSPNVGFYNLTGLQTNVSNDHQIGGGNSQDVAASISGSAQISIGTHGAGAAAIFALAEINPTATPTHTPSNTPTVTPTLTPTPTFTWTPLRNGCCQGSLSCGPPTSPLNCGSLTPIEDAVCNGVSGQCATFTPTRTPTPTPDLICATPIESPTPTPAFTATRSPTPTVRPVSISDTATGAETFVQSEGAPTPTETATITPTPARTVNADDTATGAETFDVTQYTAVPTPTDTATPTVTPTFSETPTVTETPTATPTAVGTVDVQLQCRFQGRTNPTPDAAYSVVVRVQLTAAGQSTPVVDATPTTDTSGVATLSTSAPPNIYDVRVKNAHTLENVIAAQPLVAGTNVLDCGVLLEGDANNDNCVTNLDFTVLVSSFELCNGDGGFDGRADFNQDTCVTNLDFSLLASNFEQCGSEGPLP